MHWVDEKLMYLSKGTNIFESDLLGANKKKIINLNIGDIGARKYFFSKIKLLSRCFRLFVSHVEITDNYIFVLGFSHIFIYCKFNKLLLRKEKLIGKRPLVIESINDQLFYGEYHSNSKRNGIGLFSISLENGTKLLKKFYKVRHIHGVIMDPTNKDILWITFGDRNNECKIIKFSIRTSEIEVIQEGSQQSRSIGLLFQKHKLFWGTDTPIEKNNFYCLDLINNKLINLGALSGSVFSLAEFNDYFLITTAVEPSNVNTSLYSQLYVFYKNNDDITPIKSLYYEKKDYLNMIFFGYGQLLFPKNMKNSPYIYIYKYALKGHGKTIIMSQNK